MYKNDETKLKKNVKKQKITALITAPTSYNWPYNWSVITV